MFKLQGNKISTFIVLAMLVLVISFPGIASTAKAATTANNWTAQPLFRAHPAGAGGTDPLTPNQIITAYDLTSTTNGAGTTIAIVDAYDDPTIASDLATFSTNFNLPAATFIEHKMSTHISTNGGSWAVEISLDVEWAHAIAPDATILLVEATSNSLANLLAAVSYATTFSQTGVPQVKAVSMSWGGSEFSTESADDSYFTSNTINPGIVFFAAIGDNGAGVEWPSSSPNVVSVGGTTLNVTSTGALISETAWSDSGGGVSTYEPQPAYQANYGLTYSNRACPDVSFDADPNTGVYVYDSTPYEGDIGWWDAGGTSFGTPSWAAIQALGQTTSDINFYQDAAPSATTYSSYFRDITVGSNGPYSAGINYDLVTGLGSPVTTNFAPSTAPDFSISASPPNPINITAGSSTTSTITVNSLNGFSGTVSLTPTAPNGINPSLSTTAITTLGTSTLTIQVPITTATGTYSVTVTGVSGSISHSTTLTVQVPPVPSVTVSPSSVTMDVGQGQTFTASASGGSDSYTSYQWYVNGVAQSNATASTFNYSPLTSGSYSVTVTVTDSSGATSAQSSPATVTVAASPTVSIAPAGPLTMDEGQNQTFTATVSGGSGTINYQWYLDGSAVGSNSSSYSYTASETSHTVTCNVTDSASTPVTSPSNAVTITVSAAPTVSIAPVGPLTLDAGQSQTFTASASGGSGILTYQWYLNNSLVGGDSNTYPFSESAGSYSVSCTVMDSATVPVTSAASNAVSLTLNQLTITVTQGANGVIAPAGVTDVNYGGSQAFTITPAIGYNIVEFDVNGSSVGAVTSYTVSDVTGDTSVTASFAINTYSLSVTVGENGQSNIASQTVNWGSVENFEFTPSTGFSVAGVDVNGSSVGVVGSLSITVTGPTTVDVSFTISQYTITPSAGVNGVISPSTPQIVDYGDSQFLTITPNTGYSIASLTVDGSPVTVASSYTFSNVQASHTITVTFAPTPSPTANPMATVTPAPAASPSSVTTPTQTSSPAAAPTPVPTATPTSTSPSPAPTPNNTLLPSQIPTISPNQNQPQSLPKITIYGVATAVAIAAIVAVVLVLRKSKKSKI